MFLEQFILLFQILTLNFQFLILLVQFFDRGQSDSGGIDRGDRLAIGTDTKGGLKVLGGRADMLRLSIPFVVPLGDLKSGDLFKQRFTIDRFKILFGVQIGRVDPGGAVAVGAAEPGPVEARLEALGASAGPLAEQRSDRTPAAIGVLRRNVVLGAGLVVIPAQRRPKAAARVPRISATRRGPYLI